MPRLFLAIELPESVATHLDLLCGGIPGARWEGRERLHLTLRFVGELEGAALRELTRALAELESPPFTMAIAGAGTFPPRGTPRVVWAGVADPTPIAALARKVERAVTSAGLEPESRKFMPHVTLGRLSDPPLDRVAAFIAHNALLRTEPFEVRSFALFSSILSPRGAKYRVERRFVLA
jgi:2'-5' RNA ligase